MRPRRRWRIPRAGSESDCESRGWRSTPSLGARGRVPPGRRFRTRSSPTARRERGHGPRRRIGATLWPLALYGLLSLALFGIPILGHFGSRIIAADPLDSSAFMWFLAWWPHALLHGLNPFVTHAMFVPNGFNLTWGSVDARARRRALADHARVRTGSPHGMCSSSPRRRWGAWTAFMPLPSCDRPHGAVAHRRLCVRVLAVRAAPPDR